MKIAVILTCFNRKEKTQKCLNLLIEETKRRGDIDLHFYITDDGSSDGTREMLCDYSHFINMTIIDGGNLYWDKGMYKAMQQAQKDYHDYYLMINDDVVFYTGFLDVMLDSYKDIGASGGISGATQDDMHRITTYGGKHFTSEEFINPNGNIQECNLANWNCFLVDQNVIDKVGIIDPKYAHSFGDYDYSMLMQRKGFRIYLSKSYIGTCNRNSLIGTFKDKSLTRKQRIKRFFSPKGMSFKSGIRYSFKNMDYLGLNGLLRFLLAYCRNLIVVLIG